MAPILAGPQSGSWLQHRLQQLVMRFPKGSIWQTRYLCFPVALIGATLSLSHSALSWPARVGWFLVGAFVWTFLEYAIHRWIFHYQPSSVLGKALLARLHVDHHADPKDQTQVCVPPVLSLPIWLAIYAQLVMVGGGVQASLQFTMGLALAMTLYDITHFSTHYMTAPNWLLRTLKKQHMLHHFSNDRRRFGVTSPLWDYVFGTLK